MADQLPPSPEAAATPHWWRSGDDLPPSRLLPSWLRDDLSTWLRARIAEKRHRAERAGGNLDGSVETWAYDRERFRVTVAGTGQGVASRRAGIGTDGKKYENVLLDVYGEHMEANDPRAVIDQCDAHDRIVDHYERVAGLWEFVDEDERERDCRIMTAQLGDARFVLRGLAVAYQRCPGYHPDWKP